jgi:N-acetylglucosaminyldiphosphoundecaprenol N-acetyl-beta-D-mannosaminyltransferase
MKQIPSFMVLGVRVHLTKMSQVMQRIEERVGRRERCHYIVATQMHGIREACRDPSYTEVLNSADLFVPDGISLTLAARLRGIKGASRVPGPDLFIEGCRLAEDRGFRVYFYGDTDDTLTELASTLKQRFPELRIAGAHSPPFRPLTKCEDDNVVREINLSEADIVWVGLGAPKQERWMFEHRDKLQAPVLVGVGAAFKFSSGLVKRAPAWVGKLGLEWLWRLIQEPSRVWRRLIIDWPQFAFRVILECLNSKKLGKPK